jgi:CRP/FNR family cyclic AMP-dependent transcriptional regulator
LGVKITVTERFDGIAMTYHAATAVWIAAGGAARTWLLIEMAEVDTHAVLSSIPLFAEVLDGPLLDALAHKSGIVIFPAGSILMTEGDFATSMFAIVEGTVSVSFADAHGGTHSVAALKAGDIVGEMSLMTGARRSATVVAISDVTALEITKYSLEVILTRAPELIDRFGEVLNRRQAELNQIAADAERSHKDDIVTQIKRFFPSVFGKRH